MTQRTEYVIRNVIATELSQRFVQGMSDRMAVSFEKYGPIVMAYPHDVDAVQCLKDRLAKYEETGNTEWLMDVANFAQIEFQLPRHPDAHYDPETKSIGRVRTDGRSAGEKHNLDVEVR